MLTRPSITKHNQTPLTHNQTQHSFPAQIHAHFIPSGTWLAQEYLDSCFLHDANMFAQQGMGHCRTLAFRASQSRVYRESQLDERSLSLSLTKETQRADWSEQQRERTRKVRKRTRTVRRKRTTEERRDEKERREPPPSPLPPLRV